MSNQISMFIPITKVNEQRREVWGWAAIEEPDNSDEILDYESSKPHFLDWSNRAQKRSGGKSLGNVRSMHQNVAAGKLIELRPDDVSKGFYVGAKIIDDGEWKKVEQGVYTGFSVGGSYLKRWQDFRNPGKMRYTAKPTELSIVDSPCIPSATFEMLKADGMKKTMSFAPSDGKNLIKVVTEDRLIKVEWDESKHPRADDGKFGSGGGGGESEPRSLADSTYEGASKNPSSSTNPTPKEVTERLSSQQDWDREMASVASRDKARAEERSGKQKDAAGQVPELDAQISAKKAEQEKAYAEGFNSKSFSIRDEISELEHLKHRAENKSGQFGDKQAPPDKEAGGYEPTWESAIEAMKAPNGNLDQFRTADLKAIFRSAQPKTQGEKDLKEYMGQVILYREKNKPLNDNDIYGKITKGDVMSKLERIYDILDDVEEELEKADIPDSPEPISDIPLKGDYGSYDVEQMPAPNVLMELEANSEPSQEVLASHTVKSEDLTKAFEAWLPKVGKVVKSIVAEALAEAKVDFEKSAPARMINVNKNEMKE